VEVHDVTCFYFTNDPEIKFVVAQLLKPLPEFELDLNIKKVFTKFMWNIIFVLMQERKCQNIQ